MAMNTDEERKQHKIKHTASDYSDFSNLDSKDDDESIGTGTVAKSRM